MKPDKTDGTNDERQTTSINDILYSNGGGWGVRGKNCLPSETGRDTSWREDNEKADSEQQSLPRDHPWIGSLGGCSSSSRREKGRFHYIMQSCSIAWFALKRSSDMASGKGTPHKQPLFDKPANHSHFSECAVLELLSPVGECAPLCVPITRMP